VIQLQRALLLISALSCCAISGPDVERISRRPTGAPVIADAYFPATASDCSLVAFSRLGSVFAWERKQGGLERISVAADGGVADGSSGPSAISASGRFVAFQSGASNLLSDDGNRHDDTFIRDRIEKRTERVSVSNRGVEANAAGAPFGHPLAVSADGRLVAFSSHASNLVFNDRNGRMDAFVHDRLRTKTSRVSLSALSHEGDGDSFVTDMTPAGRFVAFASDAANLVPADMNGVRDVFLRDRATGITFRPSVSDAWKEGNGPSSYGVVSDDGRIVAFSSEASNLASGDENGARDIFVRDRTRSVTYLVSATRRAKAGNGASDFPAISGDGRFIAFTSHASNLVKNDTNEAADVFLHDLATRRTERVSVSATGAQGNGDSGQWSLTIARDGSCVAFDSYASNLVPGDANGTLDVFVRRLRGLPDDR
jgi:Tol biopolymer transport system component